MKLVSVYARFFRSLNFDFVKRSSPGYTPQPWDSTPSGVNYPFVELSLDPKITTVVGANESGKSQILAAIKFGLTGEGLLRRDFCRYSPLFLTDKTMLLPEFGLMFDSIEDADLSLLKDAIGAAVPESRPERVALFRMNDSPKQRLYFLVDQQWQMFTLKKPTVLAQLGVPSFFEIDATTPLPDAVPIDYLATGKISDAVGRDSFRSSWDEVRDNQAWFATEATFVKAADRLRAIFSRTLTLPPEQIAKYELADALLTGVAGLQRGLFDELRTAIRQGKAGYAKSIVDTINTELARSLNFRHWWRQDDHFELFLEYQEYDLTFMIRDRTGRSYSFDERSGGLKYFLSYFVQYLSHAPAESDRPEILLMDEPDAYLSSSGQQDLLRVFEAFAFPEGETTKPIQVVYVTHSPFLIDKNHAERIRVLEKGRNDEGTRVVTNASRNHYEPLRSAIGEFVAETTFIGSCNLIIEGASDQVLLAGMSTWLRAGGTPHSQNLDLNAITIVPAGSAGHIPYMAYLARGRDVDKPAVIVLVDGDSAGDDAVAALKRGGPRGKQVIAPEFVLQLSSTRLSGLVSANPNGIVGIEDVVPLELAVQATRAYAAEYIPEADLSAFNPAAEGVFQGGKDTLGGIVKLARAHTKSPTFHIDKIGFARHVVDLVRAGAGSEESRGLLASNFGLILRELAEMQREALRRQSDELVKDRVNRVRDRFETDHPTGAPKEAALLFIEEVESQLDDSVEAEDARTEMRRWVREYRLEDDPRSSIENYDAFKAEMVSLAYLGVRRAQGGEAQ